MQGGRGKTMNDISINPVGKVDAEYAPPVAVRSAQMARAEESQAPVQPQKAAPRQEAPRPAVMSSDVFLKFQVNEKTNDVTVYVVDRATRKVVRAIPPEELNKLQVGDLLELLA